MTYLAWLHQFMITFYNFFVLYESTLGYILAILMSGSSHIQSVLIGVSGVFSTGAMGALAPVILEQSITVTTL